MSERSLHAQLREIDSHLSACMGAILDARGQAGINHTSDEARAAIRRDVARVARRAHVASIAAAELLEQLGGTPSASEGPR